MRRRQRAPVGLFSTESELCQPFMDAVRAQGYRVHPEVPTGWDVMIECPRTRDQIGVHAKLTPTIDVVYQALSDERGEGPEIHAVLVPGKTTALTVVAKRCDVHVFEGRAIGRLDIEAVFANAVRWKHPVRAWVPDVEVLMPAGVPSPRTPSKFKFALVRLVRLCRQRGYVTPADMKALQFTANWRRFVTDRQDGLIELRVVDGETRHGEYVLCDPTSPMCPDFRWPEITSAIELEEERQHLARIPLSNPAAVRTGPRVRVRRAQPTTERSSSVILPPPSDAPEHGSGVYLKPLAYLEHSASGEVQQLTPESELVIEALRRPKLVAMPELPELPELPEQYVKLLSALRK